MVRLILERKGKVDFLAKVSIPLWYDWYRNRKPVTGKESMFQFHYGTIDTNRQVPVAGRDGRFQFHYGTIDTPQTESVWAPSVSFNSTMVRLIPWLVRVSSSKPKSFNSTMVRLILETVEELKSEIEKFQFHYGTIDTIFIFFNNAFSSCFNSTMVRLIHFLILIHRIDKLFQFHYGTIDTCG